jgi:hypothetical protein
MRKVRVVNLRAVTGDPSLAGREKGEAHFPMLASYLEPPGPVVLDFSGVQVVTTSYFFAALWPFWTREDADGPSTFPLIANANPDVTEELDFVMKHRRIAAWRGRWNGDTFAPDGHLGVVDDSLSLVIRRAREAGSVTAAELSKVDNTNATAWSNRLASFNKQRLLRRRQLGRTQPYFLPWEDANGG